MGLSDEDRQLLDQGKSFDAAEAVVQTWQDRVRSVKEGAIALRSTIDAYFEHPEGTPTAPEHAILDAAHQEYLAFLIDAKTSANQVIARADAIVTESARSPDGPWQKWSDKLADFKGRYQAAVQRSSAQTDQLKQLAVIEEQLRTRRREAARIQDELHALTTADDAYQAARTAWQSALRQRDDLIEAQCATLTGSSAGSIRAQLKRHVDSTAFEGALKAALSGSRVPGAKIERLGESIRAAADPAVQWNALLTDLEKLAELIVEQDAVEKRPPVPTLNASGLSAGDLDRIARVLKTEDWLTLSLMPIKSVPIFEYRAREGEYIAFNNASAGQQATALLKTLLNQDGPPLLVDQPEEDLDNPVMLEIVAQLWQAKQKRQVIFASHNANLVVNGDAELVAWCDYRVAGDQSRGCIAGEGAIDVPAVRDAIKAIMEGGEAAFALRKEKYGF